MFEEVTAICPELLQWIEDNKPASEEPADQTQAAPATRKRGERRGPRPVKSDDESREKSTVKMLLGFCGAVDEKQNEEVCKTYFLYFKRC